jgi:hypothetical protein
VNDAVLVIDDTSIPKKGERSFRYAPLSSGLDIVRKRGIEGSSFPRRR